MYYYSDDYTKAGFDGTIQLTVARRSVAVPVPPQGVAREVAFIEAYDPLFHALFAIGSFDASHISR